MKNFTVQKLNKIIAILLVLYANSVEVSNSQQYDNFNNFQYNFGDPSSFRYGFPGIGFTPQIQRNFDVFNNEGSFPRTPQQYQPAPQTQSRLDQLSSDCEDYWSIQSNYQEGQFGVISIPNPDRVNSVLRVVLSLAARLPSKYVGAIELAKDYHSTVNDIAQGRPSLYRVLFPIQSPIPKVTHIYYNDQLLCSDSPEIGNYVMTITLHYTLTTGLQNLPYSYHRTTAQPFTHNINYHTSTRRPTTAFFETSENTNFNNNINDFECGISNWNDRTTSVRVANGNNAERGQFPWLAAYYHTAPGGENGFVCGGSLISTKIIVTAAHCIQKKEEQTKKKAEDAEFYLGKHRLDSLSEKNIFKSGVTKFVIHADWNVEDARYDADIALAILIRTVSFSSFVKPICLWTSTNSFTDIIGSRGTVAGWGLTENKTQSEVPMWVQIPVINESYCLRSNSAFNELTSQRTFCAGDITNAVGPCNGDSGGGLAIQNQNKWFLRGIVSTSLYNQAEAMCDTKNYAVFTDVVQFNNWIQEHMQSFG